MFEGARTRSEVRSLALEELREAAWLHTRELPHEFLSRFGSGFLTRYYRAFLESPHAVALAVPDSRSGRLEGVLISTFDTPAHYAYLVKSHGFALAGHAALRALLYPGLARDLLKTRLRRYLRGILRSVRSPEPKEISEERVGFLTYVAVAEDRRGLGVGGSLVNSYAEMAREVGLDRLELVTLPDELGAGPFYTRLGWTHAGERTSRSGERYEFYTLKLRA